jgi:hypothetical protein
LEGCWYLSDFTFSFVYQLKLNAIMLLINVMKRCSHRHAMISLVVLIAFVLAGCGKAPKNEYAWFQYSNSITYKVTFTPEKGKVLEYDRVARKLGDVEIEGESYISIEVTEGDKAPNVTYQRVDDSGIYRRESKLKGDVQTLELPSPAIVGQQWKYIDNSGSLDAEIVAIEDIMASGEVYRNCLKVKYIGKLNGQNFSGESYYALGVGSVRSHGELKGVGTMMSEYVKPASESNILDSAQEAIREIKGTLTDSDSKILGKWEARKKSWSAEILKEDGKLYIIGGGIYKKHSKFPIVKSGDHYLIQVDPLSFSLEVRGDQLYFNSLEWARIGEKQAAVDTVVRARAAIAQAGAVLDEFQGESMKIVKNLFNVRGDSAFCYVRTPDPIYGKFSGVQAEYEISGFTLDYTAISVSQADRLNYGANYRKARVQVQGDAIRIRSLKSDAWSSWSPVKSVFIVIVERKNGEIVTP